MSRAKVELDFFRTEKQNAEIHFFEKPLDHKRTIRGIQNAISRIDPKLLKSLIASGVANGGLDGKSSENNVLSRHEVVFRQNGVATQKNRRLSSPLPLLSPVFRPGTENPSGSAPLTIFYNGTVTVFDVLQHQAERIIKMAEKGNIRTPEPSDLKISDSSIDGQELLEKLNGGDLPIARKHSLQRFLEKRKERLTSAAPYSSAAFPNEDKKKFMEIVGA
ncbi:protein TIFY 9-like [Tasmannia lanceolata]|uniref:protein TIFY 9-like n=1 Tax=Tasmannia lanceolata TaxID=3420 RepID=UPI004062F24E